MAFSSFSNTRALSDPLLGYKFDLIVPSLPGGGDTSSLTLKCQSTSLPGQGIESVSYVLHGMEFRRPGRTIYTHTLSATYLETRDMGTRDAIRSWQRTARDMIANTGSYFSAVGQDVQLVLYDDTNAAIRTIKLLDCWPQNIDDVSLDSSSSQAVVVNVTFEYTAITDSTD